MRKRGKPAYKKTRATSLLLQEVAFKKAKAAERRTGKSRSDIINHCILKEADNITRETFKQLAQQQPQEAAAR